MKHFQTWKDQDAGRVSQKWRLRDFYEAAYGREERRNECRGEGCLHYTCVLRAQIHGLLARHLGCREGSRWLEVGCGAAHTSRYFARQGARVHLVDPAAAALRLARDGFHGDGLDVRLQQGDGFALAFKDATFDLVAAIGVLENLPDNDRVIREMSRVTKPGGSAFALIQVYTRMTVQSAMIPLTYLKGLLRGGWRMARERVTASRECPHPVSAATLADYETMFRSAGFQRVTIWNVNVYPALPLRGVGERAYVLLIKAALWLFARLGVQEPFATASGLGKTWVIIGQK